MKRKDNVANKILIVRKVIITLILCLIIRKTRILIDIMRLSQIMLLPEVLHLQVHKAVVQQSAESASGTVQ